MRHSAFWDSIDDARARSRRATRVSPVPPGDKIIVLSEIAKNTDFDVDMAFERVFTDFDSGWRFGLRDRDDEAWDRNIHPIQALTNRQNTGN